MTVPSTLWTPSPNRDGGRTPIATEGSAVRSLLLVRNGVDHDARVLRAARVAERALQGTALVVGVATATAPAGTSIVEGVPVLRLRAGAPGLKRLAGVLNAVLSGVGTPGRRERSARATALDGVSDSAETSPVGSSTPLSLPARARRILSGLAFARQAVAVGRQTKPVLVHANDWNTMWAGLAIKLSCGARLVYDSHELWPDRNGRWERRPWLLASEALFVRAADEVITSSAGYADVLARRYAIVRPAVVRNIPERPGVTGRRLLAGGGPRERTDLGLLSRCVVYVGGLMPGRGLEQMIDALVHLPDVRLRAIGPGAPDYRSSLTTRATAAGVGDRMELRDPVAPGDVQSALAGAAAGLCLIQPICRSYELSLPNKLFEYAAAGVPVLASDVPVIAAVVRGEGIGEVVPAGGPRVIAASLERLLTPDGWRLAAERVREFADAHDWPREARTLMRVYQRAATLVT